MITKYYWKERRMIWSRPNLRGIPEFSCTDGIKQMKTSEKLVTGLIFEPETSRIRTRSAVYWTVTCFILLIL
jgi:hypothetical protein